MFHNSGGVTNLKKKIVFDVEESPADEDESGVGGLNRTPHMVKPLIITPMSFEYCVIFVMNLKP
jgi:hypothetical protein